MIKNKNIWTYATSVSLITLFVMEMYSDHLIGSYGSTNEQMKLSTSWVMFIAVVTLAISLICAIKTRKFSRAFAIFSSLASLVIFAFAFFAYGFIGYGS